MSQWIYDQPPIEGIQFEQPLKELKDDIAVRIRPKYLSYWKNLTLLLVTTAYALSTGGEARIPGAGEEIFDRQSTPPEGGDETRC